MVYSHKALAPIVRSGGSSPAFDPMAYEARGPLDAHANQSTVWDTISIDDYMGPKSGNVNNADRSNTPSPVLPARIINAIPARRTQAAHMPPRQHGLPTLNFDMFLSQLPHTMLPYSQTQVYVTENGSMTYHAYGDTDGTAKICMVGAVGRMQDINWQMHQRNAFAQPLPPPLWPAPPPPMFAFLPGQTNYGQQTTPMYFGPPSLPSQTLFNTQSDFTQQPPIFVEQPPPKKKARKNKGKQKAVPQP